MSISFNKQPLEWKKEGIKPSENLIDNGWAAGYKPPADYFNYKWNNDYNCLKELQEVIGNFATDIEKSGICIDNLSKTTIGLNGFSFAELISKSTTTFFKNQNDDVNFPVVGGSGIMTSKDSDNKSFIYFTDNVIYLGNYNAMTGCDWVSLKPFSGNYNDLTNKPSALPANGGNADAVDGYHSTGLSRYYKAYNRSINKCIANGTYHCSNFTDLPSGCPDGQGILIVVNYVHGNAEDYEIGDLTIGTDDVWLVQFYYSPLASTMFCRHVEGNKASAWVSIDDANTFNGKPVSDFLLVADNIGKKLEGQTVYPENPNTSVTAGTGAVIIGDLRERSFYLNEDENEYVAYKGNIASGGYSTAMGSGTTASGQFSTAMGNETKASGIASIAMGSKTKASNDYSTAMGNATTASGSSSTAIGYEAVASGDYSTAIGVNATADGVQSIAMGNETKASGINSTAMGYVTTASSNSSTAMGSGTTASGYASTAMGNDTIASEMASTAMGNETKASGINSTAMGYENEAKNYQTVCGYYATVSDGVTTVSDTAGDIFKVGNGTSATARSNVLRVSADGNCYGKNSFKASGADFAEMWEIDGGNPNDDDLRGLFVTVNDSNKIRIANAEDEYILGVISATPTITGNTQSETWKDMYLTDVFGCCLTETVEVPETTDEKGNVIPAHTETRYIINPEYDPTKEYVSRDKRKEWAAVGLIGQLIVIDDGTCKAGGYCKVADGGIATSANRRYRVYEDDNVTIAIENYKVLCRIDENHIKVLIK